MNDTELLPCPFCGCTKIDARLLRRSFGFDGEVTYSPGCTQCGAVARSAAAWNRRAPATPVPTDLTRLALLQNPD